MCSAFFIVAFVLFFISLLILSCGVQTHAIRLRGGLQTHLFFTYYTLMPLDPTNMACLLVTAGTFRLSASYRRTGGRLATLCARQAADLEKLGGNWVVLRSEVSQLSDCTSLISSQLRSNATHLRTVRTMVNRLFYLLGIGLILYVVMGKTCRATAGPPLPLASNEKQNNSWYAALTDSPSWMALVVFFILWAL